MRDPASGGSLEKSTPRCVYCLGNQLLRDEQVLMNGKEFYLCAPRGQLVEGCLVVATYQCIGCFSLIPPDFLTELEWFRGVVGKFFRDCLGSPKATLYEQGRAGGGANFDEVSGFPHHAHLFCVPVAVDLHSPLAAKYRRRNLTGLREVKSVAESQPYIYLETVHATGRCNPGLYVARNSAGRVELEQSRLKPLFADRLGMPERGHWAGHSDEREVDNTIRRFSEFKQMQESSCQWR